MIIDAAASALTATTRGDTAIRQAVRPREAAFSLGIGEPVLWPKTNAAEIPRACIGRTAVYPIDQLRKWLAEQVRKSA